MTEIDENGSTVHPLAKYQWDVLSRLSLITYGDGTTDAYSRYDAGDNLQTLTQSFSGGQSVTFSYGWLKNHQRQSTAVSDSAFQYLPFTGTTNYAAADVDNGYTSAGGTNFIYDGNHNLIADGINTLTYDVENRLIQAQNGQSQYLYDPLGHRKQKQANGVTTQFVLAGDEEIADFTGTGAGTPQLLTARGVGGLIVAAVTPATAGTAETVEHYHHDVLGSSVAATSAGQSGAEAFTYGEFGEPGAGYLFTYGFAGYRYDTETGLYYVRARYYSPELGRFLQSDPIGLKGGTNLYAYVGNDPINQVDPDGQGTLQVGLSGSLSIPFTPIQIPLGFGVAVDTQGHVGIYSFAGFGGQAGASAETGLSIQVSNAQTISDLSGPFYNLSGHAGVGVGGSLDYFQGNSANGYVTGGGVTLGAAAGASISSGITTTWVYGPFGDGSTPLNPPVVSKPVSSAPSGPSK